MVREGLRLYLTAGREFEVVGEAASLDEAVEGVAKASPDVAVVDLRLPGGSGVDVVRSIRAASPDVKCLIYSASEDAGEISEAVHAGAYGFVFKGSDPEELLDAIREVGAGRQVLSNDVVRRIVDAVRTGARDHSVELTPQQEKILSLLGQGLSNREIGERLGIAEKTVRNQVSLLLGRLGMRDRTQAALYAQRRENGT